jgi:hypothetical protein
MNLKRMWHGGNSRNYGRFTEGTLHERRTLSGPADRPAGEQDVAERLYYLGLETKCLPATGSPQYRWLVLAPFI